MAIETKSKLATNAAAAARSRSLTGVRTLAGGPLSRGSQNRPSDSSRRCSAR